MGLPDKNLMMMPARLAIALQDQGWWLRSEIVWHKPAPMPESVTDRPTSAHEKVFLLAKSERYWYDADAVRQPQKPDSLRLSKTANIPYHPEGDKRNDGILLARSRVAMNGDPGANLRNVWTINTASYPDVHFATFPAELARRCIAAGCPEDGTVLDPFGGSGTVGVVAKKLFRNAVLIEINEDYIGMCEKRCAETMPLFDAMIDGSAA